MIEDELPQRPFRLGFVNNMPDPAFEETYRQFGGLLGAGSRRSLIIECYYLPSVPRDSEVLKKASVEYQPVDVLFENPPPSLVITGTEPRVADLTAEPYWQDLAALLRWAESTVSSVLLSCLASHAALLALDGISRVRLRAKQSGVFSQHVDQGHPLAAGMGALVAFPHSRLNDVPESALCDHGYHPFVASKAGGWTVASRQSGGRRLVLLQGHPEYSQTTLLREYRRDVRRFLSGTSAAHPNIPVNYLDDIGVGILTQFRAACELGAAGAEDFPYEAAARHISATWAQHSRRLFSNWLADARTRAALVAT